MGSLICFRMRFSDYLALLIPDTGHLPIMEVSEVMFAIGKITRKFGNFWYLEATILTLAKT